MSSDLWIALGVAIAAVVCYVLWVRALVHNSHEINKRIDFSRIRPWKGDEGEHLP